MIHIFNDVIENAQAYRQDMLQLPFETIDLGAKQFHGIARCDGTELTQKITSTFPQLRPTLTFARQSPYKQREPHFIHTDVDMGDWTGILYLNPYPLCNDGTDFWKHLETGDIGSLGYQDEVLWNHHKWAKWQHAPAEFNRLVLFPAHLYHSRAIYENYGKGDTARLVQVIFGTGQLPQQVE